MTGRVIHGGRARGRALVCPEAISFYGGVDPDTGVVTERGHPLEGKSVAGTVLVFPRGKGSTVGSYTLYRLVKNGCGPAALVMEACDTVVAVGAIIADVPCVDQVEIGRIPDGATVEVDGGEISVEG